MDFSSTPTVTSSNSAYFSGSKGSNDASSTQNAQVEAFTTSEMAAGSYEIRISNVRNPRSLEPT
jgi:hypothetical protein